MVATSKPCLCGHRMNSHPRYGACNRPECRCIQFSNGCEHPTNMLHVIRPPAGANGQAYCNDCQARVAHPFDLCDDCGLRLDEHSGEQLRNLNCDGFRKPSPEWVDLQHLSTPIPREEPSTMASKTYKLPDGREYVTRKLGGFDSDVEGLQALAAAGVHTHLNGPPGCGKTALFQAAFPDAENEIGHHKLTAWDMLWRPRPLPDGTVVFDPAPLTRAVQRGVPFYFDEIMRCSEDALTPLFSAMDGRGIIVGGNLDGTDLKIEPGFVVVSASNPEVRGAFMPDAITSRFHILDVEVDEALLKKLNLDQRLLVAWKNMGLQNGGDFWQPSVRDLLRAQKFLDIGNVHQAAFALSGWRVPSRDRKDVAGIISSLFGVRVPDLGGTIK